jgi:superfamily II DNA or RNA helicase
MRDLILIAGCMGIPKKHLSKKELHLIRDELSLEPLQNQTVTKEEKTELIVFYETDNYLWVPKFYGFTLINNNAALTNLKRFDFRISRSGMPNADKIQFTGTLQKSESRPQEQAICSIIKSFTDNNGGALLKAGTGMGKTVMALYICSLLKVRTAIILDKDFLIEQWRERITSFLPAAKIGLIKGDRDDISGCDIVLCSLKTLTLRPQFTRKFEEYDRANEEKDDTPKLLDQFSFVIVDECHHMSAKTFSQVLPMFRAYFILGLSATPKRKDGLTEYLYWAMGPMAYEMKRPKNEIVDVRMYTYLGGNQREIKYQNGKLGYSLMLNNIAKDTKRNGFIVHLLEKCCSETRKIIVFSARLNHLDALSKDLLIRMPAVEFGFYTGKTKSNERKVSEQKQVIFATFTMAKEALDIKGLDTVFLTMPDGATEQSIGRMRDTDKKQRNNPTVIDIVDPFSLFVGMSWKRFNLYKQFKYNIVKLTWPELGAPGACFF